MIKKFRQNIFEATGDRVGNSGSYVPPLQPGEREFKKNILTPFTDAVSDYKSPLVQYDSYDHKWDLRRNQIEELEKSARKITDYIKHHPYSTFSDDEGNILNPTPSGRIKKKPYDLEVVPIKNKKRKVNEADTSISAGAYNGPIDLGLKKWSKKELSPFDQELDHYFNNHAKKIDMKNNIKKTVGVWEKNNDGTFKKENHPVHTLKEDLAVWFGKKKKPKGSSQPKGPWVDICRKVDGKHPPCGRTDTNKGSYPKCRAAGVAGKMTDSEKRSACQQKRRAEKKDTQTGKGQKPIMTSYKPKKTKNESVKNFSNLTESDIERIVSKVLFTK